MSDQSAVVFSRTAANEDNWFGVPDPKKRKQIQDRLAQRARRKRLSALRSGATKSTSATEDVESYVFQFAAAETAEDSPATLAAVAQTPWTATTSTPESDSTASSNGASPLALSVPPSSPNSSLASSDSLISSATTSVFAALFKNGLILGIPCGTQVPWRSPPRGPEVPLPLHPTALQMMTLHIPWMDRFPFPTLRDNVIMLNGILDEEEFLHDLFTMESFTVVAGCSSWDPSGWIISTEFSKKWGYLFY